MADSQQERLPEQAPRFELLRPPEHLASDLADLMANRRDFIADFTPEPFMERSGSIAFDELDDLSVVSGENVGEQRTREQRREHPGDESDAEIHQVVQIPTGRSIKLRMDRQIDVARSRSVRERRNRERKKPFGVLR